MRVLHLFSDWKWTGPAEPVADLCKALKERGHEVILAYRRPPEGPKRSIRSEIRKRGLEGTEDFSLAPLSKPYHMGRLFKLVLDFKRLSSFIDEKGIEVVHVHNSHDHIVGGMAAIFSKVRPPVVRTDHKADSLNFGLLSRYPFRRLTDGFITFSERGKKKIAEEFPSKRVLKINPALDLDRFTGREWKDMRSLFGIERRAPVVGIAARFQRYRNTELLLRAFAQLSRDLPEARLLLVGRSSQMGESVLKPLKELGLEGKAILAGYREDDYLDTLAAMDVFVLIAPGSDGTARALREAMALGKAVVVTRRGMLPELVKDGVSGYVVDEDSSSLSEALLELLRNEALRERMGAEARRYAFENFRLDRQAEEVEGFYRSLLQRR